MKRCLIVDDSALVRKVVTDSLARLPNLRPDEAARWQARSEK